jgi:hypothetical protein
MLTMRVACSESTQNWVVMHRMRGAYMRDPLRRGLSHSTSMQNGWLRSECTQNGVLVLREHSERCEHAHNRCPIPTAYPDERFGALRSTQNRSAIQNPFRKERSRAPDPEMGKQHAGSESTENIIELTDSQATQNRIGCSESTPKK